MTYGLPALQLLRMAASHPLVFHMHVCVHRAWSEQRMVWLLCMFFLRLGQKPLVADRFIWGCHSSCGVSKRSLMYGRVVLLSLKLSSGHCANTGLVVVALMCTCKFVTCSVCEYVQFVRCMGAPATDHGNLYSHRG